MSKYSGTRQSLNSISSEDPKFISKCFNPKLESLTAFRERKPDNAVELDALYKEIAVGTQVDLREEIYAIIPCGEDFHESIVIYKNNASIVTQSSNQLAENCLFQNLHLDFKIYKQAINDFFEKKMNKAPIANTAFSLMPFSITSRPMVYTWVNPGQVENFLTPADFAPTVIRLTNGFPLNVERQQRAILDKMRRTFLVHGIIRRENVSHVTMGLLEYLQINSTKITRRVTKNLNFLDIPRSGGGFYKTYTKYYDRNVRKSDVQESAD